MAVLVLSCCPRAASLVANQFSIMAPNTLLQSYQTGNSSGDLCRESGSGERPPLFSLPYLLIFPPCVFMELR